MVTKRAKNGAQSTTCMGTISPFIKKMDHTIYYHERRSLEVGSVERSDTHSTGDQRPLLNCQVRDSLRSSHRKGCALPNPPLSHVKTVALKRLYGWVL